MILKFLTPNDLKNKYIKHIFNEYKKIEIVDRRIE